MDSTSDSVYFELDLPASVEEVWYAWTDAEKISQWFGSDPNGIVVKANLNVCPGGFYEVTFRDSNQTEHTCSGIYQEVREFRKLAFSWKWKSEPGVETFVTVSFLENNNSTKMLFCHENLGFESQHNYKEGWISTFNKLERLLLKR